MEPFNTVTGRAAAFPAGNIDTDVIMPKVFLKGIDRKGLARGLFHDLRFEPSGRPHETFILNQTGWENTRFLVVGPNFGTGSSREHAVWGLMQFGIRAVIGTSFAGIFADNCRNNGLLLVSLPAAKVAQIMALAQNVSTNELSIDLNASVITDCAGAQIPFDLPSPERQALISGLDRIGTTLKDHQAIENFEAKYFKNNPWVA